MAGVREEKLPAPPTSQTTPSAVEVAAQVEVHPLAALFPITAGKTFNELVADIKTHGLLNPIVMDGQILVDGRRRLAASRAAGIPPRFVQFNSLGLKTSLEDYIWSVNVQRRHLTDDQRAILATKFLDEEEKAARKRQLDALKKDRSCVRADSPARRPNEDRHATRRAAADRAEVSTHKVRQAQNVRKHAPDLVPGIESGKISLKVAHKAANKKKSEKLPKRDSPVPLIKGVESKAELNENTIAPATHTRTERPYSEEVTLFAKRLVSLFDDLEIWLGIDKRRHNILHVSVTDKMNKFSKIEVEGQVRDKLTDLVAEIRDYFT